MTNDYEKSKRPFQKKIVQLPLQCHIHDEVEDWVVDNIRKRVCIPKLEYPLTEFEGKYYCLFHLPTKEKDFDKFDQFFKAKLETIEKENLAETEKLPKYEQKIAEDEVQCDFRYVWFPSAVNFSHYNFLRGADFDSATFTGDADFGSVTFTGDANFLSATFTGAANFAEAKFTGGVGFLSATFTGAARFRSATFTDDADFALATFTGGADFSKAKFSKIGKTSFYKTNVAKDIFFDRTRFRGDLSFNSAIFGSDSDVFFRRTFFASNVDFQYCTAEGYLRFSNLRQREGSKFDFQEAAFENASRISFHTVRLRPNWLVNVDSRKFVFTNLHWENCKAQKDELKDELSDLIKRGIKVPNNYRLLTISFRNLAANAEESNRLEEASRFRESTYECERLERLNKQELWRKNVANQLKTKILCWKLFSETNNVLSKMSELVRNAPLDLVHFLYRKLSFYGESWFRAAWLLGVIWVIFSFAYWLFGHFVSPERIGFGESFGYSLLVMTLQRPDPRPVPGITQFLYGLETVLAPVQAALLALAIRRKFMR